MFDDRTDRINDLTKLLMHRRVARALGRDPSLLQSARDALKGMRERIGDAPYMNEWEDMLDGSASEVRAKLTQRSETMDRLRITSPFMTMWGAGLDFRDEALRRRIWKACARLHDLAKMRTADAAMTPAVR